MKTQATPTPTTLTIIGRRWFQKSAGNTYHSVDVIVDGIQVWQSCRTYGYGDHYVQTAFEWLESAGLVTLERYPNGMKQWPWQWAQDNGVQLDCRVTDVPRRKGL